MPETELRQVPYGPDAARALCDVVAAAKAGEPLAPVTVVVPSNHVGVTVRRLLASGQYGRVSAAGEGLAGAAFLTTYRLAELLGAAALAGAGRRPVSTPVLAAAVRRALAADPGLFAAVAEHPATESALVASYRELRDVPSAALDAVAATGRRAADVVRIHRAARAVLVDDWYDEEDLMASAVARLAADGGGPSGLGTVVIYLPQVVTLHAAGLLRAVAERAPVHVIAGVTGGSDADSDVLTSLGRLALDPGPGGPATPSPGGRRVRPTLPVSPSTTRIASASDADDEVRAAVRAVMDAVRAGTPLDRIAILHSDPDPYARLVHEHLAVAEIPLNGASPVRLAARVAGRTLTGLFALADADWTRHGVMAWVNGAPLLHDRRRVPTTAWERLSRRAGVVRGRAHWDGRLADLAAELDGEVVAAESDGSPAWRVEQLRADAERARSLRAFVVGLVDEVERAECIGRAWADHARWLRRLLDRLLGPPSQRAAWPGDGDEHRATERIEAAIDRLGALGGLEGPVGLDVVRRTLAVELEGDGGRVGRFGAGVLVGSLGMGVGLDLDLVIVIGLAEGMVPSPPRDDSLLPDRERTAADGSLPLRRHVPRRTHRELVAALASSERQVLSFPRGDLRRSNARMPSRWLLDVAGQLAGVRWWAADLAAAQVDWVTHAESHTHGLRTLTTPATAQEHRLRSLLANGAGAGSFAAVRALGDDVLTAGADLVAGRSSHRLTRYDGNLAGLALGSPAAAEGAPTASPTALERWAACPFDYFLRTVLGVREVDNPEDNLAITPMDKGTLIHRILERFVLEVLARPERDQPRPGDRWSSDDRERIEAIAEREFASFAAQGRTGRQLFWNRDRPRILADLQATLTFDEGVRQLNGSRLHAAELGFGWTGAPLGPVALALPDGRAVRFRGTVDRVDRCGQGGLLVADYKTGGDRDVARLSDADPDLGGTRLQLAVYGEAARAAVDEPDAPVRAEYWFVSSKGGFNRHGYALTPEVSARIGETLGLMVDGIERGTFPHHPSEKDTHFSNPCWSCDPDDLGAGELRRAWRAKGDDPAMAPYLTLIDPDRRATVDRGDASEEEAVAAGG